MNAPEKPMTKTEREELKRLVRERARVAKHDAQRRSADLKAMFEQELLTMYDYNRDEVWKQAVEEAQEAAKEAIKQVVLRCEELGIPVAFAPSLSVSWHGQGPAAVLYEQADIRRAAYKRIEANERAAIAEIDRGALNVQTELVRANTTFDAWWRKQITAAGVRHRNPHITRHTFATRLRALGVPMETIQQLLGHESIRTTMDTYVHPNQEAMADQLAIAVGDVA